MDESRTSGGEAPTVQVIVVAYNSVAYLQRCIDALAVQTFPDFKVTVWDNASADGALEDLDVDARFELVANPQNLGFAAANNRAAQRSRSRYLAFLNPDAFPEPDWLERLVAAARRHDADAVASLQIDDANPVLLDGAGDCMSIAGIPWRGGYGQPRALAPTEPRTVFSACGAAALYRRATFEALGGYEERFFCYCEDVDLGFRLRRMGGLCVLEPAAVVRHVGGASSGGKDSAFAEFHGSRNRLWTFFRNMPLWLMPLALPAHALIVTYICLRRPSLLRVRLRALAAAVGQPEMFQRAKVPAEGPTTWPLLGSLSWSPWSLHTRAIVARRLRRHV